MMSKSELRRELRLRRRAWAASARVAASTALFERLRRQPWWLTARSVAAFVGQQAEELDTSKLLEDAWATGKEVLLPRVDRNQVGTLAWHRVRELGELVPGAFGLLEPSPRVPRAELGDVDLVLIPGVAFDRHGGRLGMGGGYYDRALAPWRDAQNPVRVGLCASPFVLEEPLALEPFDVPLHWVATENEIFRVTDPVPKEHAEPT